jgi:phosphotriesterase-related protein
MMSRREFLNQTSAAGLIAATSWPAGRAESTAAPPQAAATRRTPAIVRTLLGPLDVSKLGFTLSHEHVCYIPQELLRDRTVATARLVEKLKDAKAASVDTIIDLTTSDVGRDVRLGEEVSRKSGMQIVASTGFRFAPETYKSQTVERIAELFIREIEHGIEDTGIRAGVIKVAAHSAAVSAAELKGFKAAARASKATGVPIETHTDARRRGGEMQADILEAEGVSPAKVSLGHSDDTDDVNYLIGLAKRGYTIGIDHAFYGAIEPAPDQPGWMTERMELPWQKRAGYILQLVHAGFGHKVFLSNDWELDREKVNPDGVLFNTRKTIPYLKQIGVSDEAIRTITVENPRRFFGG